MIITAVISLLVALLLLVVRACLGPTIYDRILAVNAFGTITVLFLALIGFASGRPDFLDIALLYTLINFVATIAILKFFRYRSLQIPLNQQPATTQESEEDYV